MARLEQHREHVVAIGVLGAPLGDQLEQQRVDLRPEVQEAGHRPEAVERRLHPLRRLAEQRDRLVPVRGEPGEALAHRVESLARVEPEDGAQDDLHRQPLHPRVQLELRGPVPGRDLGVGNPLDQAGEPLHALAVERGEHQLALLHVGAAVEQDHRVVADDRLQDAGALARSQHVRRSREHLLDLVRLRDHHERRREREPQREALAVAGPVALEVGERARPEADHLDRRGVGRARGKALVHAAPIVGGRNESPTGPRTRSVRLRTDGAPAAAQRRPTAGNNLDRRCPGSRPSR